MTKERSQQYWPLVFKLVSLPVEGVRIPAESAADLAVRVFKEAKIHFAKEVPPKSKYEDFLRKEARRSALAWVASQRQEHQDQNLYRDAQDPRYKKYPQLSYEQTPDFPALKRLVGGEQLDHPVYKETLDVLKKFVWGILSKMRLDDQHAEDVVNTAFMELVVGKRSREASADEGMQASIRHATVFEELIPLFCKRVKLRGIDHIKAQTRQKEKPNQGTSIQVIEDNGYQIPEQVDLLSTTISEIEEVAVGSISKVAWETLWGIFADKSLTRKDLIEDTGFLSSIDCPLDASRRTKHRRVNDFLQESLEGLREALRAEDLKLEIPLPLGSEPALSMRATL